VHVYSHSMVRPVPDFNRDLLPLPDVRLIYFCGCLRNDCNDPHQWIDCHPVAQIEQGTDGKQGQPHENDG
jgi:hypothetical protein